MVELRISYHIVALIVIVIVNSRILHSPQKLSRGNQLIHRRLPKTKSIRSWSDPESQEGRLWLIVFRVETGREAGRRGQIRIGFLEEQCFKLGVREL